jgi:CBS domain-containing protein
MQVKEIMTKNPACCVPSTSLQEVAQLMIDYDCGCIPVVENQDTRVPFGVVTDRDICCRVVAKGLNPLDLTASDAMTANVVTVMPEMLLEDCCNLMEDRQIRRVLVIDASGACCGVIAQADIAANASDRTTAEVVQEVSKAAAG